MGTITTKEKIFDTLKEILIEQVGIANVEEDKAITLKTNMRTDFGVDSFDLCCILVALEDKFGFSFSPEVEKKLFDNPLMSSFVDAVYDYVNNK